MPWCALVVLALAVRFDTQEPPTSSPATSRPAVCVSRVQITRTASLYDGPTPTCFEIELFVNPGEHRRLTDYALRFLALDPVEDDTGKALLTAERRRQNRALHERITAQESRTIGGVFGPLLPIRLDIPDSKAARVRRLRGKLEITPMRLVEVEFEKVASLYGKRLEHADLNHLDARIDIAAADPKTITLSYTLAAGRIQSWAVGVGDEPFEPMMAESSGLSKPRRTESFTFARRIPANATLWVNVIKPEDPEIIEFDFADIPLP